MQQITPQSVKLAALQHFFRRAGLKAVDGDWYSLAEVWEGFSRLGFTGLKQWDLSRRPANRICASFGWQDGQDVRLLKRHGTPGGAMKCLQPANLIDLLIAFKVYQQIHDDYVANVQARIIPTTSVGDSSALATATSSLAAHPPEVSPLTRAETPVAAETPLVSAPDVTPPPSFALDTSQRLMVTTDRFNSFQISLNSQIERLFEEYHGTMVGLVENFQQGAQQAKMVFMEKKDRFIRDSNTELTALAALAPVPRLLIEPTTAVGSVPLPSQPETVIEQQPIEASTSRALVTPVNIAPPEPHPTPKTAKKKQRENY